MDRGNLRQKAETFRKLNDRTRILILPNAWDVVSARIFEETERPHDGRNTRQPASR
jgi:2-methylisocitrate lyase-like PEP mutase family enzyme